MRRTITTILAASLALTAAPVLAQEAQESTAPMTPATNIIQATAGNSRIKPLPPLLAAPRLAVTAAADIIAAELSAAADGSEISSSLSQLPNRP